MKSLIKMKRKLIPRLKQGWTVNILNSDVRIIIHFFVKDMQIPQSDILSTNAMNRVFDTTTATYKFY